MFHVTERLLLRPAWPEDADALMRGIADEGVVRNLARAPWPYLPRHAREFVMRGQDARYPVFLITLPSAEGSKVIGCIGIDPCDSADAELGYWIARDPVAELGVGAVTRIDANATDHFRSLGRRQRNQEHRIAGVLSAHDKLTRMSGEVGPRRACEIADDAFVGNRAQKCIGIFGPGRPQQQPLGNMEHRYSPRISTLRAPRPDA